MPSRVRNRIKDGPDRVCGIKLTKLEAKAVSEDEGFPLSECGKCRRKAVRQFIIKGNITFFIRRCQEHGERVSSSTEYHPDHFTVTELTLEELIVAKVLEV